VPLVDVNHKKDVPKEGDKSLEKGHDVAHEARQALSLEATKPTPKVVVVVEAKVENKPESKPEAKTASTDYAAYISSAFDKASTTIQQTMAMLPGLSIENESGKQIDKTHSIDKNLDLDALMLNKAGSNHKKAEASETISGFTFNSGEKVQQFGDAKKQLTLAETKLSTGDWNKLSLAYDLIDPSRKSKIESTAFGSVHRDGNGRIDDVRHNGQIDIRSKSELMSQNDAGEKLLTDLKGNLELKMDKDGRAEGVLKSGERFVIERNAQGKKQFYFLDAQGQPTSDVYVDENGHMCVEGKFVNGKIVTTESTLDQAGGVLKVAEAMKAEAARTMTDQFKRFKDGIITVTPEGTLLAVKQDHTSFMSTEDGRYIARGIDGSLTIYQDGKEPVKLSRAFVLKELASKAPQVLALHNAMKQLMSFGVNSVLTSADGRSSISVKNHALTGTMNEVASTTNSAGQTVNRGLLNGESQTIDTKNHSVAIAHSNGKIDKVEVSPKGDFKFEGKGYTYDNGIATTADGNVISQDKIKMANGTEYHNDGSVNYADGSKITASGKIINSSADLQSSEKVASQQAADSQASSAAGYALGLAGAMRSKAASGHATASDIASLEATFAGLCEAVTALSATCDLSTQFKLYSAEGSVSESLTLAYANMNDTSRQQVAVAA